MKKIYLLSLFIIMMLGGLNAQKFYYFQSNGEVPSDYDLNKIIDSTHYKLILTSNTNDKLSASQSLPFSFKFSGFTYNNYKVSDNGYISFNTSTNYTSYKPDSFYSNSSDLRNCLFPFWHDFRLKKLPFPNEDFPNKVYSYTVGAAPERKHIIQFFGLTQSIDSLTASVTNADVFAFAIIFHEGDAGRFDYVYNFFGKAKVQGLIGFADNSGNGLTIKNNPINFPVAKTSEKSNIVVYQFHEGLQPKKALYVRQNILESKYLVNEPVTVKSKISNIGTDTVYTFDFQYAINNTDSFVDAIDLNKPLIPLLPNGENAIIFSHTQPWTSGNAGSINSITTKALLKPDTVSTSSEYASNTSNVLRIYGRHPIPRNVLFEISTGGWCGYCPNAHAVADDMSKLLKTRLIPVMHHFGDQMETEESNKINTAYQKGYPYGVIDRKYYSGQATGWPNIINQQKNDSSVVDIQIFNRQFDAGTRLVSFSLKIKFHDYLFGKFRVGAMVTENNVRGYISPSQWSQNNYYSKYYNGGVAGGPNHPYYNELHYMDGYLHQHVVLDMPYGAWGKDSSLPEFIKPEDEFIFNFTYKLPPTTTVEYNVDNNTQHCSTIDDVGKNEGMYKPNDIGIIGFVSEYNENVYLRSILNANANGLLYEYSALPKIQTKALTLYPNPANNQVKIILPYELQQGSLLQIIDELGNTIQTQQIEANNGLISLDLKNIPTGLYIIKINTDKIVSTQVLSIAH